MQHKQVSFLFSLTMCFLYILYKGIILKKVVGCYRLLLSLSLIFFGLLAFFLPLLTYQRLAGITALYWKCFCFFYYFFYPSSSTSSQSHSALKPFRSTCFAFTEIKSVLIKRQDFQSAPLQSITMARSYFRRELWRRKRQPESGAIWSQFFQFIIMQLLCESETLRRALLKSEPFKSSWHFHRSLLYSNLIIEQHREEDITYCNSFIVKRRLFPPC